MIFRFTCSEQPDVNEIEVKLDFEDVVVDEYKNDYSKQKFILTKSNN